MSPVVRVLLASVLAACGLSAAVAATPDTTPGAHTTRHDGSTRVDLDVTVPGKLLDYAVFETGNDGRRVVLLVEPVDYAAGDDDPAGTEGDAKEDEQEDDVKKIPDCPAEKEANAADAAGPARRLYTLPPSGEGDLVLLRDDLPHDSRSITPLDADGDGGDELLLERENELLLVEPDQTGTPPVALISDPSFEWTRIKNGGPGGDDPGAALVTHVGLGNLRLYGPAENEPGFALLADVELPIEGSLRGSGINITSTVPSFVGRRGDGTLIFATRPKARIGRRLEVQLVEVDTGGEATVTECWAGLPEAEDVLESFFLLLDDRAMLLVTTKPAAKLALFGEKRLRLYGLERDRSRLGVAPTLAVQSRMNLWQDSSPLLHDVNGDGGEDLVLGYWKGLMDEKVVLDVYLRREDGSFAEAPQTTAFNVKDGNRDWLRYGSDLDGDGLADLLVESGDGTLQLHAGLASANGKRVVDKKPRRFSWSIGGKSEGYTMVTVGMHGAGSWRIPDPKERFPRLVDVDGDGSREIVLQRRGSSEAPGRLKVFRP